MSDEPDFDAIPAFIRSMLDPYVDVSGPPAYQPPRPLETTYIPEHFRLTPPQLQAIGRVTSTWAVLEHIIEIVLSRLCMAPQYPTLALTNGLGIDNRIKALKTLISLHRGRYRQEVVEHRLLTLLDKLTTRIAPLKDKRNRVAHLVWIAGGRGDVMTGRRPRAITGGGKQEARDPKLTVAEVNALADQIQELADSMFLAAQLIPEVDEGSHAQSLSRSERPRLPGSE